MTFYLSRLILVLVVLSILWVISQQMSGNFAYITSGVSLCGFVFVSGFMMLSFWSGIDRLHYLKNKEYASKADSFLVAADGALLHWGKLDGSVRSYATVRDTFVWKHTSVGFPKQVVVLEMKGTVKTAEQYYRIRDSLQSALPDTLNHEPMQHIARDIYPGSSYSDILIRGLLFWPAVRIKSFTFSYEDRYGISSFTKSQESG